MLFDLDFANNAVITQIFDLIAEIVIPIGIPTKEAKAEIEAHPVTAEIKISKYSILQKTPIQSFYASSSLIHFDLFLQLNNFLLHLYFLLEILDLFFLQT